MKKLDAEMKRTDQLLYQMIPKKIADRLRSGEKATNLCEVNQSNILSFDYASLRFHRPSSVLFLT